MADNAYFHFPFCRSKCAYCALHSRAGSTVAQRTDYIKRLTDVLRAHPEARATTFKSVYFGGGSPASCDLRPLLSTLGPHLSPETEFTVELHPRDVTDELLATLHGGGVNRISMGVQSLDDKVLQAMRRDYTATDAARAFARIKTRFENAGIDLIVGYPGEQDALSANAASLASWGLAHCSVYSLIVEERSILGRRLAHDATLRQQLPTDDETLDRLAAITGQLSDMGLVRYEISNYARPGFECRHNLAVWRGEDYLGLGEGACGRLGLVRTTNTGFCETTERVTPEQDAKERALFGLRTTDGLDARQHPEWRKVLEKNADAGLLTQDNGIYRLTDRGTEVCDAILAELI